MTERLKGPCIKPPHGHFPTTTQTHPFRQEFGSALSEVVSHGVSSYQPPPLLGPHVTLRFAWTAVAGNLSYRLALPDDSKLSSRKVERYRLGTYRMRCPVGDPRLDDGTDACAARRDDGASKK